MAGSVETHYDVCHCLGLAWNYDRERSLAVAMARLNSDLCWRRAAVATTARRNCP